MVSVYPKIETTKFNFVSVEGQYFLGIAARTPDKNAVVNFLNHLEDLISYVDVSKVGFGAPAVEIIFSFSDRNLLTYLSEKSVFSVSIGPDMDSQVQSTFNIITSDVKQDVEGKWLARIVGIYDVIPYLKVQKKNVYANYSSEVAKEILQKSFGKPVKSNVDVRSKDFMYWIQPNESDYAFLHTLWLHSYTPDSIWLTAVDFDGTPRITDLRKQAKLQTKLMLTTGNTGESSNTYTILDTFDIRNNSAVYNSFGGYAQTRPVYNVDEARHTTVQKKNRVLLSDSNSFNKNSDVNTEASYSLQTSNVHSNFQSAPLNNRSFLNNLKCFQLDVTIEGSFVPANLLDYVLMKDCKSNGNAQEDYSGMYCVGKIAHQIANKRIYTHLTLWRESQNKMTPASVKDVIKESEVKVDNYQDKIDCMDSLMNADAYLIAMQGYANLENKIIDMENSIKDKLSGTEAYKAYKNLYKKYNGLKSYISDVYSISQSIINTLPFMDKVQQKLNSITYQTPIEDVQSTIADYLNLRKYTGDLGSKIEGKISSNSVYVGYTDVRSKLNQMTYTVSLLQDLKIIGDLDEYLTDQG